MRPWKKKTGAGPPPRLETLRYEDIHGGVGIMSVAGKYSPSYECPSLRTPSGNGANRGAGTKAARIRYRFRWRRGGRRDDVSLFAAIPADSWPPRTVKAVSRRTAPPKKGTMDMRIESSLPLNNSTSRRSWRSIVGEFRDAWSVARTFLSVRSRNLRARSPLRPHRSVRRSKDGREPRAHGRAASAVYCRPTPDYLPSPLLPRARHHASSAPSRRAGRTTSSRCR